MRPVATDIRRARTGVRRSHLVALFALLFVVGSVLGAVAHAGTVSVTVRVLAPVFDFVITGVADGGAYNETVSATASSRDATAVYVATLDDESYVLGTPISEETTHTLVVTGTNEAGEMVTKTVVFRIDYTPPPLTVEGIDAGASYNHPVTPVFSTEDGAVAHALLNGEPFASGTILEDEGTYLLEVTATDAAGNVTVEQVPFAIDLTPPDLAVLGVSEGRIYNRMVVPSAFSSDPTAVLFATLNGELFFLGSTVMEAGEYLIVVTATDPAGNVTTKSVNFTIDYSVDQVSIRLSAWPEPELYAIGLSWEATAGVDPAGYRLVSALSPIELLDAMVRVETTDESYLDTAVLAGRVHYYRVFAFDAEGREIGESNIATAAVDPVLARLWGNDRVLTAIDISRNTFDAADAVILATSGDFADALAASGLAGSYRAPILLTRSGALSAATRAEIARLGAGRVIVVGGSQAVSVAIEQALFDEGLAVTRLAGPTRYETAIAIAEEIAKNERAAGRPRTGQAFLARGDTFPDALSVSPFAYSQRAPVLFTRPDSLPAGVRSYARRAGFTSVLVAGGPAAVSDAVVADFASASGASVTRAGGADRYATSMVVSQTGVDQQWAQWRSLGIATGTNFPDALSGSVNTGEAGGVLLLTPNDRLDPQIATLLADNPGMVFDVTIYGGPAAVAADVETALRGLLIY